MTKRIKEWKTGCAAFLGNAVYRAAEKKLQADCQGVLLMLFMDVVLTLVIVVKMWPVGSFGSLVWAYLLLRFAWAASAYIADALMTSVIVAIKRKSRPYAQLYDRRKREKTACGMEWEKIQKEKEEQEKIRRERAEQERLWRERLEREKAERERAEREKAERERAEREKAQQRKQKQTSSLQQARQLMRVKESYTRVELKKARNALIKQFHPDNTGGGDEEMCKRINTAYNLLLRYAKAE
ncbi:MAG: hypothetical protein NC121_06105 [Blautia sp.]|nr:hypothetical protein [Blautia sp.]